MHDEDCLVRPVRLYWMTAEDNARARLLYDKVAVRSGFIRYHRPLRA
jgi:hypothetical protein